MDFVIFAVDKLNKEDDVLNDNNNHTEIGDCRYLITESSDINAYLFLTESKADFISFGVNEQSLDIFTCKVNYCTIEYDTNMG